MKGTRTVNIEMDRDESNALYSVLSKLTRENVKQLLCSCVEGDSAYKVIEKFLSLLK